MKLKNETTEMDHPVHGKFICSRCGNCCLVNYILCDITEKEWIPIIEHIRRNHDGKIGIECDCGCGEITEITADELELYIKQGMDDLSLFMTLDYGKCPFLKEDGDKFYCEIYDMRPDVCRGYRCDLGDDGWKKYVSEWKK